MTTEQLVDECRQAFEDWYWPGSAGDIPEGERLDDGSYDSFNADLAWDAWQAAWNARASQLDALVERLEAIGISPLTGRKRRWVPLADVLEIIRAAGKGEP